ncbi:MAG TPA: class I SAM-dependent methyltransferase [Gemmatimonadaceae bacterium]|nr:class I SAM-dependent methyltransferase [Gemmatimonadaceae bacterium]
MRYGIPDFRLQPDPYITVDHEMWKIDGFIAPGRSFEDMVRAYYVLTPESPPELHSRYIQAMAAATARGAGMLRKLRARYVDLKIENLLDVGCGTGGMSIAAAREGMRVVGVDVALRWLVMGQQRLIEEGVDVPLICANAESLPFRVETFDAVVADAVIEHVRSPERMRDEALRVLEHGGAFFFTTNNRFSILPEPHVRIWGFGLMPRVWMEGVATRVRQTPYKARLLSRIELSRIFRGVADVMLPWFEPGELGQRNERIRQTWDQMRRFPPFRALFGFVVPQYFIIGRRDV